MKTSISMLLGIACLAVDVSALDWRADVNSGSFSSESHPGSDPVAQDNVREDGNRVGYLRDGNWISFQDFDFGDGVGYIWIEGATPNAGGTVELRLGSDSGTKIGEVVIKNTGDWNRYKPFAAKITVPISGIENLYLKCVGGGDYLFNLGKFRFQRFAPDYVRPGMVTARIERDPSLRTAAGSFTHESHEGNNDTVRSENGEITYINAGAWVRYEDYDFRAGANHVTLMASSQNSGGILRLRLDDPTNGELIGSVTIPGTGSWNNYQTIHVDLERTITGAQNLYFNFVSNGSGNTSLYNIADFLFGQVESGTKAKGRWLPAQQFDEESTPGVDGISGSDGITSLTDGSWVAYHDFNFGSAGANLITVTAATPNKGGLLEMRLGSPGGPLIATVDVTFTGNFTHFREYTAALSQIVSGTHHLYLKFVDTHSEGGNRFNLKNFIVEKKTPLPPAASHVGVLAVYDPVTGLDPSPYYTYSVQKVSDLNAPLKQNATNWMNPFAWFSECKTWDMPFGTAYYMQEIAGWSHTYCNFEMGENTPIVVKITRTNINAHGAPTGPISMANVHPAHKVQSCEIINGEVYVTMSEPALVTVDIDGQMDARDAPRSAPAELASSKPYASRQKGSHAVSIFANPVIVDKPVIGASGVRVINPGDPLPAYDDPSWTTLYFTKGVHHFSRNPDGSPGIWKTGDAYILMSDKTCYVGGDAMIYGNFDGRAENSQKHRVRVYGHGTISGAQMPHWEDPYWDLPSQAGTNYLDRPIAMASGYNCRFEGITLADPANHGIAFDFGANNLRSWIKQVSWRANSDMGGIPGIVEDCFFRLQDDGPYISGDDFRRNTLWFDCNGAPFRGTFIKRGTHRAEQQTVVEDCDIIYARANWGGPVMGVSDYWETGSYPDGTKNTAQHVVFRNIRVTDPRPTRELFGFGVPSGQTSAVAGMRFENIEFRHPHSWGRKSTFYGNETAPIHHLYFDGVFIEGEKVTQTLFNAPSLFESGWVSDFVFRDSPDGSLSTFNLLTDTLGGSISLSPPGGIYQPGTVVTVSATPSSGYRFQEWGGDLSGTSPSTAVTMDGHKSVTASFVPAIGNATLDTAGAIIVLDYDSPQNTYIGDGILKVSSNGSPSGQIFLGQGDGDAATAFSMTGGLITIDAGASLVNGGWAKGNWANNQADMQVNGILDLWNGQPVRVNALSGAGGIEFGYPWGGGARQLHVGVNGGSGLFSGPISDAHPYGGTFIELIKDGRGTQTFDNLANQRPKEILINEGVVNLSTFTDVTLATTISGAGNLRKSGTGNLTLSGSLTHTGNTVIEDGVLSISQLGFVGSSTVTIGQTEGSLAVLHLPSAETHLIAQLIIDGVVQPGNGSVYGSHNSGEAITGPGKIQVGTAPTGYAAWVFSYGVIGEPADDDDKDGLTNFEEYAFGCLPKDGSSSNPISVPFSSASGTFSYTRRNSALMPPLSYTVWYCTSLGEESWVRDTGAVHGQPVVHGDVETVQVTISLSHLTHSKLFVRVRAE